MKNNIHKLYIQGDKECEWNILNDNIINEYNDAKNTYILLPYNLSKGKIIIKTISDDLFLFEGNKLSSNCYIYDKNNKIFRMISYEEEFHDGTYENNFDISNIMVLDSLNIYDYGKISGKDFFDFNNNDDFIIESCSSCSSQNLGCLCRSASTCTIISTENSDLVNEIMSLDNNKDIDKYFKKNDKYNFCKKRAIDNNDSYESESSNNTNEYKSSSDSDSDFNKKIFNKT